MKALGIAVMIAGVLLFLVGLKGSDALDLHQSQETVLLYLGVTVGLVGVGLTAFALYMDRQSKRKP